MMATGLRGYWMGYFAARSGPLGPVGPDVVTATFYNFNPDMVRRAIPDAWSYATPAQILPVRRSATAGVLRRGVADAPAQRPLAAANRDLPEPDEPTEALWQLVTTLREHRGDGHAAVLPSEQIDGCAAHVLCRADRGHPAELWPANRGWTEADWARACAELAERGLLANGQLTDTGRALRAHVEARIDAQAATAYRNVDVAALLTPPTPAAKAVAVSGEVPYPNPMGANPA